MPNFRGKSCKSMAESAREIYNMDNSETVDIPGQFKGQT